MFLRVAKSLECRPDQSGVRVLGRLDVPAFRRWSDAPQFPESSPRRDCDHSCPTSNCDDKLILIILSERVIGFRAKVGFE